MKVKSLLYLFSADIWRQLLANVFQDTGREFERVIDRPYLTFIDGFCKRSVFFNLHCLLRFEILAFGLLALGRDQDTSKIQGIKQDH